MNVFEKYKRLIRILAAMVIISAEVTIYMLFWYNIISPSTGVWYWRKGNWVIAILYAFLALFFTGMYGGFKIGYLEKWNVIYSQALSMLIVNIITYIQIALLAYHFTKVWVFALMMLCDLLTIIAWSSCYDWLYRYLFPPRKLLFLFSSEKSKGMIQKIDKRKDRYNIVKMVHIDIGIDKITEEMKLYEGVILSDIPTDQRNVILKICFDNGIRAYMTPKISDIIIRSAEEMHIFDTPLILARNTGLTVEQELGKRCLDILVSLFMLLITSPIMLITAISVKVYDKGSVIYKQKRLTYQGKIFYVYKFRSMRMDAEADGLARLAEDCDSRITPVGKIIRLVRIDELPQLYNVLKGDMSLVGPRPERPEIAYEYQKKIPQFNGRLKVKAGLTGYAQIYGKYNTTPYDKLRLDLIYIQNYSLLLDLKLILLTLKILFMKDSTEGIKNWEEHI